MESENENRAEKNTTIKTVIIIELIFYSKIRTEEGQEFF